MGIRPVDMQVIVHKTQEIHPAKQNVVSKQENELANVQSQNKEETVKKNQTVNTLEHKDNDKIKNNKKDNETDKKKKKKKKKKLILGQEDESVQEEAPKTTKSLYDKTGSKFDMKV